MDKPALSGGAVPDPSFNPGPLWDRPLRLESTLNLHAEPVEDGLRLRSDSADPQLILAVSEAGRRPVGPGLFWVSIRSGAETLAGPAIYLDFGDGFDPRSERRLTAGADGLLFAEIADCTDLKRIRLDPSFSDCDAVAAAIGLTQAGEARDALGSPALNGVAVGRVQGVDVLGDGRVRIGPGSGFELHLSRPVPASPLFLLELGIEGIGPDGVTLQVSRTDGPGERYHLPVPARDALWRAVLPHPETVAAVRVTFGDEVARPRIRRVTARPLTSADWQACFEASAAGAVVDGVRELHPDDAQAFLREAARLATFGGGDVPILRGHLADLRDRRRNRDWDRLSAQEREAAATLARDLRQRPLISVLTPVYNPSPALLDATIESVRAQVYDRWELCIADDASTDPEVAAVLQRHAQADPRIKVVRRQVNGHISAASNTALELVTGEWVALLDHDDLLSPDALLAVAELINAHPTAQIIYSDEDKIDENGGRSSPFRKPQFSPALFRSQNYLNHLTVHRTETVRAAGGWRAGFEGAQDHDLALRVLERIDARAIHHIPRILYHWRTTPGSTAVAVGQKSYAFRAGLRAVEEHVARTSANAHVEKQPGYPYYRVRYAPPSPAPLVSLMIPTRDQARVLETAVTSILDNTEYAPFEVLILDNGSVEPATAALFARLSEDPRVRVISYDAPFNFSAINNFGARHARGKILGLINNDVEVIGSDWLTEMVSWVCQPDVGCVGAKLYYGHGSIQHAGVVLGIGGVAGHGHKHFPRDHPGYFSRIVLAHDVSAVTGACLLVRRSVYDQVGGLNEVDLKVAFNDVDFCLKVREAGYRNIFTPYAELYHHESVSRGAEDTPEKQVRFNGEVRYMLKRWGPQLRRDPFYSPHLTLTAEDFSPAPE